jgi:hypothetical protein
VASIRRKPWISVIFLVMVAALLITWAEAHSRLRRGVLYDAPPKPVRKETSFVLTGKIGLMLTTRIDTRNLDLTVPVNSWVLKGEIIGEADSGITLAEAGRAAVVSPADGLLVASDVFPGTFGIASDPDLVCVHTRVYQADISSLRLGQPAQIEIYGDPAVTLQARVSEIARTPIVSPDGAAYPVALSVEDRAGKRFAGASVRIRLQTTAQ